MKTLAIRLDDELHAQLSVLAQLSGTSLTDEIEHEAQARQAAIATLFGTPEQPSGSPKASSKRPRSSEETPESS